MRDTQSANLNKETKKLFRLQTAEKYNTKRINGCGFKVFTNNLDFRAFVDTLGIIIYVKGDIYDKIELYKLKINQILNVARVTRQ